jgi:hypothetical protein
MELSMMKTALLVAGVGLAGLFAAAAMRPASFHVERTSNVDVSADKIYPLITNLRQFNRWNPYARKDPAMKASYSGPASGHGAGYAFHGNKDVGKGNIAIVETSAPNRVTMRLDMMEPFEGHNVVEFRLVPRGSGTDVTRAMSCRSPLLARMIGLFIDMDRMIGRDFETGLSNLKLQAEAT